MNNNTVKRSCTAGIPDFLPRQKNQKTQAQQKEDMWPEINPWNVIFSVLGGLTILAFSVSKNNNIECEWNSATHEYELKLRDYREGVIMVITKFLFFH
ncbi:TPA_asm: hypothetical protein G0G78_27940 [Salmonella enterica]|nr:hypothetical protein [Salmonella enterica]EAO7619194.1 hypothetical protein [Salmonella enterica]EAU9427409.1 hypothetical protein [Salmonella enterica]EBT1279586.1 hypothetical protein [Salmonella enterica]HAC8240190.1 hypothetical protein [Salmonella enterica]